MIETLGDVVRNNAYKFPRELAYQYVMGDEAVSFAEHCLAAERLASAFWRLGLRPQDRISILSKNTRQYMEVYGACELIGFVAATVNWRLAAPEIAYIVNDASPRVLAFEAQYAATVDAIRNQLTSVELYLCFGGEIPPWATDFESFRGSGDEGPLPAAPRANQLAQIIYTSGTTGRPKGVMRTHRSEIAASELMAAEYGILISDTMQLSMPVFHVGARYLQMAAHLRGASVVLHHEWDVEEVIEAITRYRVTMTHMAPTLIQTMLDLPGIEKRDLSSLHTVCYAAAPMPVQLLRRGLSLLGPVFVQHYGMTEGLGTTLHKKQHKLDGSPEELRRLGSVGQAAATVDVRIVDEDGEDVPLGQPGEILTRTQTHMSGYWNNSAATLDAMRDGWYRTGDIGTMDVEGFVYLVDRKKDMIISGGENIYSREVEDALATHPGVADVAVIGRKDDYWGESVCAVVVPSPDGQVTAETLISHCRSLIASYKKPRTVIFVEALPRLPSGKVDKVSLRHRYGELASV